MVSLFKFGGIAEAMAAANRVSTLPYSLAMPAALAAGIFALMPENVRAQAATPAPQSMPEVVVTGTRSVPATIPRETPAVTESIEREQIAQTINASDAEDVLKYLPGLHVRKRYIGDFDHALLATRTNGTGVNARSLVYADGILLSNLLGNSNSFTPRWGLVTPEEIARVDVIYGPYSAAYAGNAVGGVVNFVTRMPTQLETYAKLQYATQNFKLYGTDERFSGKKFTAGVGNRLGDASFFINYDRLDSASQPLVFVTKNFSTTAAAGADPVVTGAVVNQSPTTVGHLIFGSTSQINTAQDHLKAKFAYDFTPTARLTTTAGVWDNVSDRTVASYVRDAAGNPVYSGNVNVGGQRYTLAATDFTPVRATQQHWMHGLQFKTDSRATWDWEATLSTYHYNRDLSRQPTLAPPASFSGGAGRITDMNGTGWSTFDAKGTWRPQGFERGHTIDFGIHHDRYRLRSLVSNAADWISGSATTEFQRFAGQTQTTGLFVQDAWRFAQGWKATLGLRWDRWQASDGFSNDGVTQRSFGARTESSFSPKLALHYQWSPEWNLRASYGRAVRTPTVAELYQGGGTGAVVLSSDANLKPEKAHSLDVTAERDLGNGSLRVTYFQEHLSDALYAQTNVLATPNVTSAQNVDRIRTRGVEVAYKAQDVGVELGLRGLDLLGSVTYTDSMIVANANNPGSVGKQQPRIPDWRATVSATWRQTEMLSYTASARYSGRMYNNLDNSDTNGNTYTGSSRFFVMDARMLWRIDKQWSAALGVDNLTNATYWAFHPYPQRTWVAQLRFAL